jgi:hypothetical protein
VHWRIDPVNAVSDLMDIRAGRYIGDGHIERQAKLDQVFHVNEKSAGEIARRFSGTGRNRLLGN